MPVEPERVFLRSGTPERIRLTKQFHVSGKTHYVVAATFIPPNGGEVVCLDEAKRVTNDTILAP